MLRISGRQTPAYAAVAIADPAGAEGSKLDNAAKIRAFTNYLPGFNIPMLPH